MVLNISLRKTLFASAVIVMIVFWYKTLLKHDIFFQENIFVTLDNEH